MTIKDILGKLEYASNHPKELMKQYLDENKKVIGLLPVYTPTEIVHASGMIPMGVWGGKTEIDAAKEYFPAFACSIMQAILEYGIKGSYDGMSAAIIPCMCDSLITMTQNYKSGVSGMEMIAFVHPQNRKIQAGTDYLVTEYEGVKKKLEKICGHEITEEALQNSIDVYNEHRKVMQEFIELVPKHLNTITSYLRNAVIRSGLFMKVEEHTDLVKQLNAELKAMPEEKFDGKTVMVTGIIFDDKEILNLLEENNIAVAYDNVAQETLQFDTLVPNEGKSALERLALQWRDVEGSTLAYDPQKKRGKMIVENCKRVGADGVIYAMMKFCDPEEYDYPIVMKDLKNADIPHLYLEIEQQVGSNEQIRTRVQTFAEMLV